MTTISDYKYYTDLEDGFQLVVTDRNPQYLMIIDKEGNSQVKAQLKHPIDEVTISTKEGKRIFPQMEGILNRPKLHCEKLFESALLKLIEQYFDARDNAEMNSE